MTESLAHIAELIRREKVARVEIAGHTDAKGSDAYNLALSERRAWAVQSWLSVDAGLAVAMGVDGRGESEPVAANARADGVDDPEGRQKNRRVEITLARQ